MAQCLPVDVIVPAYNAAPYLRESLASVAEQTRTPSEVIVVDDGSTDDTARIARSFGARVISIPNAGVAAARNVGIRASTAPYVALLDADDRWYPQRLEAQWPICRLQPEVLLIASDYVTLTEGERSTPLLESHPKLGAIPRTAIGENAFLIRRGDMLGAIAERNFVLPSSMLMDRRLFDRFGLFYRTRETLPESDEIFVGEDFEWLLRALRHTDVAFVDRPLVDYRIVSTSLSSRRGRIRYGDYVLGKLVAANPDAYAEGAPALLERLGPHLLIGSAIAHLRSGEFTIAAARLREAAPRMSRAKRIGVSTAAWLLDKAPLQPLFRPLRNLRRPAWTRPRNKRP